MTPDTTTPQIGQTHAQAACRPPLEALVDITLIRGLITLLLLISFLAIVAYAWSGKNKARFDEAAQLPLNEPNENENG